MKAHFRIFSAIAFSLLVSIVWGQQKAVQYTKDFEFKNGLYISFNDFKNNSPVPVSKIVSDYNKNAREFFEKVLSKTSVSYLDSTGKEQSVKTNDLWGYCANGIVYINHGSDFNRVTIIGSLCHFVASVPVKIGISDPFMYNDPFYNPQQYTYVAQQYMLDMEIGKVLEFTVDNMKIILARDEVLLKDFDALKKKQQRDSVFLYLRKYNEKHPVYFPE